MNSHNLEKAAQRGEPSYVWRAGQERRLNMILSAGGDSLKGRVLENGCGVGIYLQHLAPHTGEIIGLEYDFERTREARQRSLHLVNAAGEQLPFSNASFSSILSHEVLEHVRDDRLYLEEMVRVLEPGGVILLFTPNIGYPYETHGVFWRGRYHFGNIPLVHYLPSKWRKRLMPHVRVYSSHDLDKLFKNLPVRILHKKIIFGAYDNIIDRYPAAGRVLRNLLQWMESTPLHIFGLSHYWVIQKDRISPPQA